MALRDTNTADVIVGLSVRVTVTVPVRCILSSRTSIALHLPIQNIKVALAELDSLKPRKLNSRLNKPDAMMLASSVPSCKHDIPLRVAIRFAQLRQ
ncbi:hypothetical protein DYB25_001762 [Aphanomyces astaci]|uniref:Uncharacterized protein n=1 Tax=Aphanomyces astaci TaxID=112090 RepID=A0A397F525_APHAT|nr:hypothetical protein DYB25_001762 [Aphanomyces astaci]RHY37781.1 hypothetical protein DYB38_000391 [Aphanomyces astaci]RHY61518.1 hypothetical protein DYB30_002871 [Aphanomyces astaci]RHY89170.1 hypothetical protein DYB26_001572 [Aphanomyces astaci]RHZ10271.1 hypothetical protein DYB31_002963 [Aphanomyces astaci]